MPGEPTIWALTEAERTLNHAMALSTPDHNRLRVAIARALDAAREEGRRAGLEEAARETERRMMIFGCSDDRHIELERAARASRTLITKEPK